MLLRSAQHNLMIKACPEASESTADTLQHSAGRVVATGGAQAAGKLGR